MNDHLSECLPLPRRERADGLAYYAALTCLGCEAIENAGSRKDSITLRLNDVCVEGIHRKDWMEALTLADELWGRCKFVPSALDIVQIQKKAREVVKKRMEADSRYSVAMVRNNGSSGFWRMVLPARHIDASKFLVDVTLGRDVRYESLLPYDTVFVQMVYDWESVYVLEMIAKAGRKVVYDFDDDIFRLSPGHYLSGSVGLDQMTACLKCMEIASVVTCTTAYVKARLVEEGVPGEKVRVIPNALPMADWRPVQQGSKVILWAGSMVHSDDWGVCLPALDKLFKERKDLTLHVMGHLPPVVEAAAGKAHWKVMFTPFQKPDAYFHMLTKLQADVGIAPLAYTHFNAAKSPIKWMEYAVAGIPTVATDIEPYSKVVKHGYSGLLARDEREWYKAISMCLDNPSLSADLTSNARSACGELFDLAKAVNAWQEVLKP